MKTSQLIETLTSALATYGDVDVKLMDYGTGDWHPIQTVMKLHPYTGPGGIMNRDQPVECLAITTSRKNSSDLILRMA